MPLSRIDQRRFRPSLAHADLDPPARRRVFDRVRDQVHRITWRSSCGSLLASGSSGRRIDVDRVALLADQRGQVVQHRIGQAPQPDGFEHDAQLAAFEPRGIEQIVHEPDQPVGRLARVPDVRRLLLRRPSASPASSSIHLMPDSGVRSWCVTNDTKSFRIRSVSCVCCSMQLPLGVVARDRVDQLLVRLRRWRSRAASGTMPSLQRYRFSNEFITRPACSAASSAIVASPILQVHEIHVRLRDSISSGRVAEHALPRLVYALEIPVEAGEAQQILRHREETLDLLLRAASPDERAELPAERREHPQDGVVRFEHRST